MTTPAIAWRLLFAAYYTDNVALAPAEHDWLQSRLADLSWTPTLQDCANYRDRLLAWLDRYGQASLITTLLQRLPAPAYGEAQRSLFPALAKEAP